MKPWAELTAAARSLRIGGVVAVIIAILWGIWTQRGGQPADGDAAVTVIAPAADSAATDTAAAPEPAKAETAAAPAAEPVAAPTPVAPKLDVVRVTRDGSAIIAGVGVAGARLSLRVDGTEVISVPADQNGNFVGMFNLPPSDAPRQLSIIMVQPDGTETPAAETVAIAPTQAPEAVADASATPAEPAAAEAPATSDEPAALLVTPEGAKVLQGIGDADVTAANVTVDAITYTPEGAVQLAGRGTGGAGVRIYLNTAAVAETTVAKDGGWSVTLSDIAPGLYTLRADQVDVTGKVTSRFETPFKRESLEALAAATGGTAGADAVAEAGATTDAATDPTADTTTDTGATTAEAATGGESAASGDVSDGAADPATADAASATGSNATGSDAADDAVGGTEAEGAANTAGDQAGTAAESDSADVATQAGTAISETAETAAPAASAPVQVTVQPGYSLWRIARENLGDGVLYVQVFEANKGQIRDPDLIYPGQVFSIPGQN